MLAKLFVFIYLRCGVVHLLLPLWCCLDLDLDLKVDNDIETNLVSIDNNRRSFTLLAQVLIRKITKSSYRRMVGILFLSIESSVINSVQNKCIFGYCKRSKHVASYIGN